MNFATNHEGQLTIGGVVASQLVHTFQTPLYVYDVGAIRHQIRAFKQVFETAGVAYAVSYASKAFATIAMYEVAKAEPFMSMLFPVASYTRLKQRASLWTKSVSTVTTKAKPNWNKL